LEQLLVTITGQTSLTGGLMNWPVEAYGQDNEWLTFARKGILCHHGALLTDVRLPLERLMREDKPQVIISTSTLGQGVNLGVSTVIFSTLYQAGEK
jgi:replicative superfamily II helicase